MYKRSYKRKHKKLIYSFTDKEYTAFLLRLQGCLIFRGKSSLSYKWMDKIFLKFKRTFGVDTDFLFKRALKNLIPFIGYKKVKMGKKVNPLPILLPKNKRQIILINWLLRDMKNKTNVRGYKFKDIWDNLYNGLYKKGSIIDKKSDYFDKSIDSLYLLKKKWARKSFSKKKSINLKKKRKPFLNFYIRKKRTLKYKQNDLKFLLTRCVKLKYRLAYKLTKKNLLKSKISSLWLKNNLNSSDKSRLLVKFFFRNKDYVNWGNFWKSKFVKNTIKKK